MTKYPFSGEVSGINIVLPKIEFSELSLNTSNIPNRDEEVTAPKFDLEEDIYKEQYSIMSWLFGGK